MKSTTIYNSSHKTKEQLLNEFVVRTKQFELLYKDIRTSKMEHPEQNYLIIGPRGSGKTTLVHRLKYAIEEDRKLNRWLLPVLLTEEQYQISQLLNLWETIADSLEQEFGFIGLNTAFQKHLHEKNAEKKCYDELLKALQKNKKKIVLFLENIGDFLRKLDDIEVKRFREVLTNHSEIRVIGTSSLALESLFDYNYPLLEFFKTVYLEGLSQQEVETVLLKLSELNNSTEKIKNIIEKEPHRITILRQLTGGVPRTVVLLFEILSDDKTGDSINDLKLLVDRVTPLFKARMEELPLGMQKIVDAVAKFWDAVSVKDLSEKLRMESKVVSAQLRQLEKNQVILKKTTNTKNHLYQLSERFFNIWYLMRYGREGDKTKVIWLVKFFESWYSKNELELHVKIFTHNLEKGIYNHDAAGLTGSAFLSSGIVSPEIKFEMLETMKKSLPKEISKNLTMEEKDLLSLFEKNIANEKWEEAIKIYKEIKDPRFAYRYLGGIMFLRIKQFKKGLTEFEKALNDKELNYWRLFDKAIIRGIWDCLQGYKGRNFAMKYFTNEIKNDRKGFAIVLAEIFEKGKDFTNAEKFYKKALIEKYEGSSLSLAWIYYIQNKNKVGAKKLMKEIDESENLFYPIHYLQYAIILVWLDNYENSLNKFHEYLVDSDGVDWDTVSVLIESLLYKKQFNTTLNVLKQYGLIEKFKPLYYATLYHLQDEYPNEYLKMGDELKETVNDILKNIEVEYERLK
ncbi:MAG: ATP-binding protein [Bacteroidia bacterium]